MQKVPSDQDQPNAGVRPPPRITSFFHILEATLNDTSWIPWIRLMITLIILLLVGGIARHIYV
jgi:hypothetical protein